MSVIMDLNVVVSRDDESNLYRQIEHQLREFIAFHKFEDGEQLPTQRAMATILGVNLHTVGHAYKNLANEGILEVIQGKGTFIARKVVSDAKLLSRNWLVQRIKKIRIEAAAEGMTTEDIIKLAKDAGFVFSYHPKK